MKIEANFDTYKRCIICISRQVRKLFIQQCKGYCIRDGMIDVESN